MPAVFCKKCLEYGEASYSRLLVTGGTEQLRIACGNCHETIGGIGALSKNSISPEEYLNAPIVVHDIRLLECGKACCFDIFTQDHHWLPREISNKADAWPTGPLCLDHHNEWHKSMRDGNLNDTEMSMYEVERRMSAARMSLAGIKIMESIEYGKHVCKVKYGYIKIMKRWEGDLYINTIQRLIYPYFEESILIVEELEARTGQSFV